MSSQSGGNKWLVTISTKGVSVYPPHPIVHYFMRRATRHSVLCFKPWPAIVLNLVYGEV